MQQKQKVKKSSKGNRYLISFVVKDLHCWVQIIASCTLLLSYHICKALSWVRDHVTIMYEGRPILKVVSVLPWLKKKIIYNNLKNLFIYPLKIIWEHSQFFFYINKIKFCFIIYFTFSEYYLVVYIERDVACSIDNKTIVQQF